MTHASPHPTAPPVRVLVLVDQPRLAEVIRLALDHGRVTTRVAPTAAAALATLAGWRPHLAVIDMDIGQDGVLDQLGYTAPHPDRVPVVGLTRRGDLKTKLAAFERGVDDILTVPFAPEELVARVLAVMRRVSPQPLPFTPVLRLGELELDILHRSVRVGGPELHLSSLEQSLLYLLAANAGQILTRDEILDNLWGVDFVAESNIVDRHVRSLRIKLQNDARRPRYIATVPGQGYRFVPIAAD